MKKHIQNAKLSDYGAKTYLTRDSKFAAAAITTVRRVRWFRTHGKPGSLSRWLSTVRASFKN